MKIDHIQLAMPAGQEEIARAFFAGLLNMEEEPKPEPLRARGGCWFRKESLIIHLGVDEKFTPQRKAHPAFLIEDCRGLADLLEKNGHSITWDDALPNRKRFYTSDPFGNRIEFIQDGDGFSQKGEKTQKSRGKHEF